jgi:hypothetical protein
MTHTPNECYVDVWREADFRGETRRLYGPASHPTLHFREGDWGDDIGSIRVGPHAFVMVFRGENYAEEMLALGPNDEASDLRALNFENAIDSLRLINSLKIFDRLYEAGRVVGDDSHAPASGASEDAKAGRAKAARKAKGKRR